ncbi:MAG TPA: hypothetical protein VK918_08760 [Pyrinomonadaceae bacterium]|nr:hypothetical protein [Pyrinomonadaceae bacterium]
MITLIKFGLVAAFCLGAAVSAAAQVDASNNPLPFPGTRRQDIPRAAREMLTKKQIAKARKDHEEMIERGEQARKLADELELSLADKQVLSAADKKKLSELERLASQIRKDLGGGNDEAEEPSKPGTIKEAVGYLTEATRTLVSELEKGSRFSISVVAIQSSNSVIRLARFLRFAR